MAQQLRHQTFNSAKVGSLETPRVAELFKHLPLREFPGCLLFYLQCPSQNDQIWQKIWRGKSQGIDHTPQSTPKVPWPQMAKFVRLRLLLLVTADRINSQSSTPTTYHSQLAMLCHNTYDLSLTLFVTPTQLSVISTHTALYVCNQHNLMLSRKAIAILVNIMNKRVTWLQSTAN